MGTMSYETVEELQKLGERDLELDEVGLLVIVKSYHARADVGAIVHQGQSTATIRLL